MLWQWKVLKVSEHQTDLIPDIHLPYWRVLVQKWLDPSQDHKAKWLYIWAKEAGLKASRDELAEMLATDSLTPPLADLWKQKTREQKLIERLCKAGADGNLTALQVHCHQL